MILLPVSTVKTQDKNTFQGTIQFKEENLKKYANILEASSKSYQGIIFDTSAVTNLKRTWAQLTQNGRRMVSKTPPDDQFLIEVEKKCIPYIVIHYKPGSKSIENGFKAQKIVYDAHANLPDAFLEHFSNFIKKIVEKTN